MTLAPGHCGHGRDGNRLEDFPNRLGFKGGEPDLVGGLPLPDARAGSGFPGTAAETLLLVAGVGQGPPGVTVTGHTVGEAFVPWCGYSGGKL